MKSRSRFEVQNHRAKSLAQWLCFVGCLAGLSVAASVGLTRTHAQDSFPLPAINPPGAKTPANAAASAPAAQQPGETAADPNEPEVAKQCADLLKMATELKTEVDKTTPDTLSVTVVRKAGEIEHLAHKVRSAPGKN
jgi:hypothetical protein